jgi:hypothetical protein
VLGRNQVPPQVEQVVDGRIDTQGALGLPHCFESTHAPLSHPRRLMGKLCSIVGIPGCVVNRIRDQLSMCDPIAAQPVRHDLPGLATVFLQQSLEKTPCCPAVSSRLQKHIDHLSILVHRSPQIVLLAVDLHEDFINEEGIPIALMFSPESPGVLGTEFDLPESNEFVGDRDPSLGQ